MLIGDPDFVGREQARRPIELGEAIPDRDKWCAPLQNHWHRTRPKSPRSRSFETGRPAPKGGFKRSTAKSSKSSSPQDQPFVPNKHWSHRISNTNRASLPLPRIRRTFVSVE